MVEYRTRRNLPFLHRNFITGVYAAMGVTRLDDHYGGRAAKRPRLDGGQAEVPDPGLPSEAGDMEYEVEIDVKRISPKLASCVKLASLASLPPTYKCRAYCQLTIKSRDTDESKSLYVCRKVCEVETSKNPVGPGHITRIKLPNPFRITLEQMAVVKPDGDGPFLADGYTVEIDLDSAADGKWPPPNIVTANNDKDIFMQRPTLSRHSRISAATTRIYSRTALNIPIRLKHNESGCVQSTDYVLDTEIKFSTGYSKKLREETLAKVPRHLRSIICRGEAGDELAAAVNGNGRLSGHAGNEHANGHGSNGLTNGHLNGDSGAGTDAMEEDADGEANPSPSRLRARGADKNYNLKQLSSTSVGRKFKPRKQTRRLVAKNNRQSDDAPPKIHYQVGQDEWDPVEGEDIMCPVCGISCWSIKELGFHFEVHPNFSFKFSEQRGGKDLTVVVHKNAASLDDMWQEIHLGRPPKDRLHMNGLELDTEEWKEARHGKDHGKPIPPGARVKATKQRPVQKPEPGRALVPKIPGKHPLFDPLSRRRLLEGEAVPLPAHDDDWLVQKHRDNLKDFIDVSQHEKEFMIEWDSFWYRLNLNSDAYFADHFRSFVDEKARWLVASPNRLIEFGELVALLISRGLIDQHMLNQVDKKISEARKRHKASGAVAPDPAPKKKKRALGCAVCNELVPAPSMLVCSNKACEDRLYHDYCAKTNARVPIESIDWLCNQCAPPT